MKLTKSQKIALSGLGVAVCAFAGDRVLGGGAVPAEAAGVDSVASTTVIPAVASELANTPTAAPLSAAPAPNTPGSPTLAARLRALAVSAETADTPPRDAFAWPAAVTPDASRDAAVARAAAFKAAHTLKAVVGTGARGQAMVDGRLLTVGQSLDGFELIGVDAMRATFAVGAARVDLALPDARADGR